MESPCEGSARNLGESAAFGIEALMILCSLLVRILLSWTTFQPQFVYTIRLASAT